MCYCDTSCTKANNWKFVRIGDHPLTLRVAQSAYSWTITQDSESVSAVRRLSTTNDFSIAVTGGTGAIKIVSADFDCSVEQDTGIFATISSSSASSWDVSTDDVSESDLGDYLICFQADGAAAFEPIPQTNSDSAAGLTFAMLDASGAIKEPLVNSNQLLSTMATDVGNIVREIQVKGANLVTAMASQQRLAFNRGADSGCGNNAHQRFQPVDNGQQCMTHSDVRPSFLYSGATHNDQTITNTPPGVDSTFSHNSDQWLILHFNQNIRCPATNRGQMRFVTTGAEQTGDFDCSSSGVQMQDNRLMIKMSVAINLLFDDQTSTWQSSSSTGGTYIYQSTPRFYLQVDDDAIQTECGAGSLAFNTHSETSTQGFYVTPATSDSSDSAGKIAFVNSISAANTEVAPEDWSAHTCMLLTDKLQYNFNRKVYVNDEQVDEIYYRVK